MISFNEEGLVREGCSYGVYRLTPSSAAQVASSKTGWLPTPLALTARAGSASESKRETRGHKGEAVHLYALGAATCPEDRDLPSVDRALERPGNAVRIFNGGEGMVVVQPSTRLAWYLYYG